MDRISNLSDDLLLKILSSLPTKDVITTMLMSKRWKFLWTMVPKLYFADHPESKISDYGRFLKYVDRVMVLHRAPVLESLKFELSPCCSSQDIATWVRIGMVRDVRELDICNCELKSVKLPKSLYTYEKLEVLKLAHKVILDVPDDVCFPALKSLHLVCVEYRTDECHRRLLSGCPVLEEFVLDKTENSDVRSMYVESPTLQTLTILEKYDEPNFGGSGIHKIVINVPSLKYLNFVDLYGDLCLSEEMPELVEANVHVKVIYEDLEMLMGSVTSVKRLSLCLSAIMRQDQDRIGFDQLVHLELCGCVPNWWNLLTWMLESSPKLQVLKLNKCKECYDCTIEPIHGSWGQPSSVPECLLLHLHTFEWKYYNGRREEKNLVAYILKNAKQLKTAAFSVWEFVLMKRKELSSLPRGSSSCQVLLD